MLAETEAGAAEGRGPAAPGESAPVKLLAARAAQAWEGTKCRRNRVRAFVEYRKTGTARNPRLAPYRAAGSLSSVDGESTDTREQGKTQCGRNTVSAPHTQRYLSAAPRAPRSRTELVNLRDHLRPPMSGQKLDTEETAKRSQIKKGNHFRKDRCNRLKSL